MAIFCDVFGHRAERECSGRGLFFDIEPPWHDGCGRAHRDLYCRCDRCGARFYAGRTIDLITERPRE